ncbi:MAG: 1-acyl-sn-glycerol-3-phosphate acyltransferase [Gammaproteobacteria bacterium]|nr:1-acyl-sn-glycerol-3-phosphate acyltransferase [Gammaproteobacteria bacterium]
MFFYLGKVLWRLICWLELAVLTLFLYILSFLPKAFLNAFYFSFFRIWCKFFVRALGIDLRLHQKNRIPLPKQFILVANHPSAFEDVGIPALFNVYSLAKDEVRKWWWAGRINVAAGTLFVKRESSESRHQAFDNIIAELKKGRSVVVYPEGGCKGRRVFETFRYGAFDISLQTGIPIVPVFLHYEMQEEFEWQPPYTLLDKIWHFVKLQNNRANYYVYDAIEPGNFTSKEQYMEYVHSLYLGWQARYLD